MTKEKAIELLKESGFKRVIGFGYRQYAYKSIHFDCSNDHSLDIMAIYKGKYIDDYRIIEQGSMAYSKLNSRFAIRYAKVANRLGEAF